MPKITIIGAGFVGSTASHWIAAKSLGDIVLLDIVEGAAIGKALDLSEALPIIRSTVTVRGTKDYKETKGSDVIVITAGIARKPGMTRDDLLKINTKIVADVAQQAIPHSPAAVVIVVSNPLDAMCYVTLKSSHHPRKKVIGMAGTLDTARFHYFIAEKLNVPVTDVDAIVIGTHGDTMVPLPRHTKVKGRPLLEVMKKEDIDEIIKRTINGGAEIVNHLQIGSAYFAPGAAIMQMVDAIINDTKKVLPCSVWLEGELGIKEVFLGVPVSLGCDGWEEVVDLRFNKEEMAALEKAAAQVKETIQSAESLL